MIATIRGILTAKKPPFLVVETYGVGYEIQMPINGFYLLPQIGEQVFLYTQAIVREDTQALFGFLTEKERELFRSLIKVNGVGPKSALAILSGVEPDVFVHMVLEGDEVGLTYLPGVGKKTAQRLIIEMRSSLDTMGDVVENDPHYSVTIRDAISALIALGYKPHVARKAVAAHKDKKVSSEDLVRLALKEIK